MRGGIKEPSDIGHESQRYLLMKRSVPTKNIYLTEHLEILEVFGLGSVELFIRLIVYLFLIVKNAT